MSFLDDANKIAEELRQKRLRKNPVLGKRIKIEMPTGAKLLTTEEAARMLNRSTQTLRLWACKNNGPIKPVRIHGRLAWNPSAIEALLNGEETD